MTLPVFAAQHCAKAPCCNVAAAGKLVTDIQCPYGTQQQTCCTPWLWSNDETDRWTGKWVAAP